MFNKGGRPKKEIDLDALDKLCAIQCTGEEISSFFDIDYDTLNRICKDEFNLSFSEYFAQKKGKGKIALRRAQYQSAINGNTSMLIWLGKNWLSQSDKQEVNHTGGTQIKVTVDDIID
jgi:zona occludens toxin (predicted ATPase)